jgi:hypothetical protein
MQNRPFTAELTTLLKQQAVDANWTSLLPEGSTQNDAQFSQIALINHDDRHM